MRKMQRLRTLLKLLPICGIAISAAFLPQILFFLVVAAVSIMMLY